MMAREVNFVWNYRNETSWRAIRERRQFFSGSICRSSRPGTRSARHALDQWATKNVAPGTLLAQKLDATGQVVLARPLCQYPQYPRYTGPANDAAAAKLASSYTCTVP
jgi:Tannase and feruloyl esterase